MLSRLTEIIDPVWLPILLGATITHMFLMFFMVRRWDEFVDERNSHAGTIRESAPIKRSFYFSRLEDKLDFFFWFWGNAAWPVLLFNAALLMVCIALFIYPFISPTLFVWVKCTDANGLVINDLKHFLEKNPEHCK